MTGAKEVELFSYVPVEDRGPAKHPLRVIRSFVDPILAELSPRFDAIYAKTALHSDYPFFFHSRVLETSSGDRLRTEITRSRFR